MGRSQRSGGGVREVRAESEKWGWSQGTGGGGRELGAEAETWAPRHAGTGVSYQGALQAAGSRGAGRAARVCPRRRGQGPSRPASARAGSAPTPAPPLPCRLRTGSRRPRRAVTSGHFLHCSRPRRWPTPRPSRSAPAGPAPPGCGFSLRLRPCPAASAAAHACCDSARQRALLAPGVREPPRKAGASKCPHVGVSPREPARLLAETCCSA